jgi:Tfp pilus assembly protein PilX
MQRTAHRAQRGVAALAVGLILLFGMTLIAFFANRGMIFEQRTSANQYRSTKALEMAQAGLEWAVARINEDRKMQAPASATSCATTGAVTQSFADRYLPLAAVNPALVGFGTVSALRWPGCSSNPTTGATTCSCKSTDGAYPTYGADDQPRFRVRFDTVAGDIWAVRVTSFGCTGAGVPCDAAGRPDAVAIVSAIYKMQPTIATAPGAGLIAGTTAVTSGSIRVVNHDPTSGGVTINTGSSVTLGSGTEVNTLPGTPARSSVLDNDTALLSLAASPDGFFKSFFGVTMDEYKVNSKTYQVKASCPAGQLRCIQCSGANNCGTAISAAYDSGARQFWSDVDVQWTSNLPTKDSQGNTITTLGAPSTGDPIVFASSASTEMKGNLVGYGLFYTETATIWDYDGSGTATIYGSFIARSSFDKGSGTLNLIYDPSLFGEGDLRGTMVRVPGTWRDSLNDYTASN